MTHFYWAARRRYCDAVWVLLLSALFENGLCGKYPSVFSLSPVHRLHHSAMTRSQPSTMKSASSPKGHCSFWIITPVANCDTPNQCTREGQDDQLWRDAISSSNELRRCSQHNPISISASDAGLLPLLVGVRAARAPAARARVPARSRPFAPPTRALTRLANGQRFSSVSRCLARHERRGTDMTLLASSRAWRRCGHSPRSGHLTWIYPSESRTRPTSPTTIHWGSKKVTAHITPARQRTPPDIVFDLRNVCRSRGSS